MSVARLSAVLALLAVGVYCILENTNDRLIAEKLPEWYIASAPSNAAIGDCNDVQFNYCQARFNQDIGINQNLTYKDADVLLVAINRLFLSSDFSPNVTSLCNKRQQFYNCLGVAYQGCLNSRYLVSKNQTTTQNVITYVQMWKHLEFICSGGLEVSAQYWSCIRATTTSRDADIQACRAPFNNTIFSGGTNQQLCALIPNMTACVQNIFQPCGSPVGWVACEDERLGFADGCRNLYCSIN